MAKAEKRNENKKTLCIHTPNTIQFDIQKAEQKAHFVSFFKQILSFCLVNFFFITFYCKPIMQYEGDKHSIFCTIDASLKL